MLQLKILFQVCQKLLLNILIAILEESNEKADRFNFQEGVGLRHSNHLQGEDVNIPFTNYDLKLSKDIQLFLGLV